jgi:hypothetical protein
MLNKLERKLGRFAIPNLMLYLIAGYVLGYLLMIGSSITTVNFLSFMTLEPYYILHRFQFWRIFTWIMIPESSNILFFAIMLMLYYQLGTALERSWGTFRFNVYIFGGMLFTLIGAFVMYGVYSLMTGMPVQGIGNYFSMQYVNLTIFLAFAVCFPDMQVYLYFILPIKMKWMAVVYVVLIVISLVSTNWAGRVAILCSVLNFVIFYLSTRNYRNVDPREVHRRQTYRRQVNWGQKQPFGNNSGSGGTGTGPVSRHKCAICGRTELTNPELEFRFCSKCNGNYEYCQDHLFTHTHIK